MQKIYFKEEQRFTQPILWIILVVSLSAALTPLTVGLFVQLVQGKPYGDNPTSDLTLLIIFFLMATISLAVLILFRKMRLITEVRQDGLYVRFPPFFLKEKRFDADTVKDYAVRTYKPIREYGGWGVRHGIGKQGKAYNVKGKLGMQLVLKNGKGLLIGTQRGDAFLRAMNKMMNKE